MYFMEVANPRCSKPYFCTFQSIDFTLVAMEDSPFRHGLPSGKLT